MTQIKRGTCRLRTVLPGLVLLFCARCCLSQTQATVVGKTDSVAMIVGGQNITVSELCTAIESLPPPQRAGYALHPALAAQWFGPLVALAQEATREHVTIPLNAKDTEVDRDNALVGAWVERAARNAQPTENEIENYYKEHSHEFEQASARHILISYATAFASRSNRSEAAAKMKADEIVQQLKQGGQFGALAVLDSEDPYTRDKGGDLGYVSHHQLEPELDHALWSLDPGQTSAPFKGRFGYEIVQVEDRGIQPLEGVRETIVGKIKSAALDRKQQEITAAAHVSLTSAFADSPLPCGARQFTLNDSLRDP